MYRVHLDQFEGPLDLLLFFIRRDELDIYDIPVAQIADEFLAYVKVLERIDLDGVGDFVYMAALLVNIKARMLLPRPELDDEGEEIDPRRELVERLLAYIRYKEAAERMGHAQEERAAQFTRGDAGRPSALDAVVDPRPAPGSVFDLVAALKRVLAAAPDEAVHAVEREAYTLEELETFIVAQLAPGARGTFHRLVAHRSKAFVVTAFLALLEMARRGMVALWADERLESFFIERSASGDGAGLATA